MKIYEKACKIAEEIGASQWNVHTSLRVWTRGDYARYKEPNKIEGSDIPEKFKKLVELYPHSRRLWVRGEFASDPYDPAIMIDGIIYINRKSYIQFGSKSILRNGVVWRSLDRPPEELI